jgi:type VI secretion system protein ImpM
MAARTSLGFFGKLPCNGDFLERRVPQAFLDVWDPWLQQCVHASRQALEEAWLPSYLSSPLWRFVLSESVCGSGAYAGVVAPSVDRVGRYFPLTILAQIDIDTCPLEFATQRASWFEAIESLVLTALEESSVNLDWFDAQVIELGRRLDEMPLPGDGGLSELMAQSRFPEQGSVWRVPLQSAGGLQIAINAFAYRQLAAQLRPVSLWWTEGSGATAPSWLSLRGLPAPAQFSAMLNGRWAEAGWNDLGELSLGVLPGSGADAQTHADVAGYGMADALALDPFPLATGPGGSTGAGPTGPGSTGAGSTAPGATGPGSTGPLSMLVPDVDFAPVAARPSSTFAARESSQVADSGVPRVTLPEVQLSAIEANRAAFIVRPEVGLWAIAATDPGADPSAARLISDALQQLNSAPSLTGLVEAVRQLLGDVHRRLRHLATRDVQSVQASANFVALLVSRAECALLSAGEVQKFRVRERVLDPIDDAHSALEGSLPDSGSLMDLLAVDSSTAQSIGAGGFQDLRAHYDRLQREDQWILCAGPVLAPREVGHLIAAAAGGTPISVQVIVDMLSGGALIERVVPALTVEI